MSSGLLVGYLPLLALLDEAGEQGRELSVEFPNDQVEARCILGLFGEGFVELGEVAPKFVLNEGLKKNPIGAPDWKWHFGLSEIQRNEIVQNALRETRSPVDQRVRRWFIRLTPNGVAALLTLRNYPKLPAITFEAEKNTAEYHSAEWLNLNHGIIPERLSEAAHDDKVRQILAPKGYTDVEGKRPSKLYHVGEAVKHCSPKHRKDKTFRRAEKQA